MQVPHLAPLTSLRFIAAFAIVLLHSGNYWSWAAWLQHLPLEQGVSFFFVLSGFILTHVYKERALRPAAYLWGRFARLWPTHVFTLGLVLLFIRTDSQQLPGTGFFDPTLPLLANAALLHALVPYQIYVFSWNSVSWSISTELGFYLAFPWLLASLRATWSWKLLGCFALILGYEAIRWLLDLPMQSDPTELNGTFLTYSSPLFRGFEFVAGMSTYHLSGRWRRADFSVGRDTVYEALALLGIMVWYWVFTSASVGERVLYLPPLLRYWIAIAGSCWVFAGVIAVFSRGRGLLGQALSHPVPVWLGQISFALYMVHQVVMKWIAIAQLEGRLPPQSPLTVAIACLVAAALLYHLIERPAQALLMRRWRGETAGGGTERDGAPSPVDLCQTPDAREAARENYLAALRSKQRTPPSIP